MDPLTSPTLPGWKRLQVLDAVIDQAMNERIAIIKDLAAADAARGSFCPPEYLYPTSIS